MMMIAAAGHGSERRALYDQPRKPIPRWMWTAIGVSILAHVAGGVWLYNQRYEAPIQTSGPDDAIVITMEPLRPPEPPTIDTPEPPRPPLPVHSTRQTVAPDVPVSPFPVPDEPTTAPSAGGPISLDPGPTPEVTGTGTEPTAPPPAVIRNPQWLRQPSAAQMERAYPRRAATDGLGGRAVLSCRVTASGEVTNCSVQSETPEGQGFGAAALSLSRYFRLSPRTVDGNAVEGARVTIPLTFSLG